MAVISINTPTELLLDQWGKWNRSGLGLGIGTPSNDNYSVISDELALVVDCIICKLTLKYPTIGYAVSKRYIKDYTYSEIAKGLKTNETMTKRLVDKGIAWIDGHLEFYRNEFDKAA